MAEPFKDRIGPDLVRTIGRHLERVWPGFPPRKFERGALDGIAALELKARVVQVAAALAECLPRPFSQAVALLEKALAPARDDDDLSKLVSSPAGLAGWPVWPMTEFVARNGLRAPRRALSALHAMTQRHTAEYAIRPFLVEHRELTMRTLHEWLDDPSPHVRRLVSEGSRPRLPWGMRLNHLVDDPSPCLPLLERLQDDPSSYVRRSVANHLNDIAKDHPEVVARWLEQHLPTADKNRRALLRHASRTLIKRCDRKVLAAWGLDRPLKGEAVFRIDPARAAVGGEVNLHVELHSRARSEQALVVDYVVHHVRADGSTSPRTWKGWRVSLRPGERRVLARRHSLQPVTTRRDHPGRHAVELIVNGRVVANSAFVLDPPATRARSTT